MSLKDDKKNVDFGQEQETDTRVNTPSRLSERIKSSSMNEADRLKSERPIITKRLQNNNNDVFMSEAAHAALKEELQTYRRRSSSLLEYKEHAHIRLREELEKAQSDLKLKDQEVKKLTSVRDQMDKEIDELSASLFEEANKMVQDAHLRRIHSEKLLKEANFKVEGLEAEVTALKTLVLTSTPSTPNRHLHPQLSQESPKKPPPSASKTFVKGHRRSTSHHNISREIDLHPLVRLNGDRGVANGSPPINGIVETPDAIHCQEVDPLVFDLFQEWRKTPSLEENVPFIRAILKDEVFPCMHFVNSVLSRDILDCIISNTLTIEPLKEASRLNRTCALTQCERMCCFEVRLRDDQEVHYISQFARNRLAAVCDFFAYLRYITQGLVKSSDRATFYELARLRKNMCMAKLGLEH